MNEFLDDDVENRGFVLGPEDGTRLEIGGNSITFKVTSTDTQDRLGVYEIGLEPKTVGAQLHYHRFMDETFVVQEGVLTVDVGTDTQHLSPGGVAFAPRFTPHGFRNDSDNPVKATLIFSPGQQREGFFYGLQQILSADPVDAESLLALASKWDQVPVDPSNVIPGKIES
jgi:quercetin dioxygenase-like cupin family protein